MKRWNLKNVSGNKRYCNLFVACKSANYENVKTGKKQTTFQAVQNQTDDLIKPDDWLITESGDWGIKREACSITNFDRYFYTIQNAAHGGAYMPLEIDSVTQSVARWYTTNLGQCLAPNVYPVPLNIKHEEFSDQLDNRLRGVPKNKLCYANFTITSPYRIRLAEWCWTQNYIDCNFPKRYPTQDVELEMPILKGVHLEREDFLETLASYNFAIAPAGNGLDTFRVWECIMCNTVPIVQDNWMNKVFSKIWPMIRVSKYEYSDLPLLMNTFFEKYGTINYNRELLLENNLDELLERIKDESDRIRRERV